MKLSTERILTTHVGSLPRPQDVSDMLLAKENETLADQGAFDACMVSAVADVVRRQVDAGVDIVSDGEMSKSGYSTYVTERLHGFAGDSARKMPRDMEMFPAYVQRVAAMGEAPQVRRAPCVSEISIKDEAPLRKDLANMAAALDAAGAAEGFMNAASPGVIAFFQPNEYYPSEDAYLDVLCEMMKPEYEAIHAAGLVIQLDCPDLAMTRHSIHKDKSDAEFVAVAERNIEVLNASLENVPAEAGAAAPLLGQLRRAPRLRHRAGRDLRHGDEGEAAGDLVRGREPAPRPRVDRVPRARPAGGQGADPRRDRFGLELRRAPRAGGGAHLPLRRHRGPRARAGGRRLRLRHLRGLRAGWIRRSSTPSWARSQTALP